MIPMIDTMVAPGLGEAVLTVGPAPIGVVVALVVVAARSALGALVLLPFALRGAGFEEATEMTEEFVAVQFQRTVDFDRLDEVLKEQP